MRFSDIGAARVILVPLVAGILLRVVDVVHTHSVVAGLQQAAGIVIGVLAYLVAVRWGAWRWLAALAVVPCLLDARVLAIEQAPGSGFVMLAAVSLVLVALTWRPHAGAVAALAAVAVVVVLLAGLLPTARDIGDNVVVAGDWTFQVHRWMLVVAAVVGLLAMVGIGRSAHSPLRQVVAVTFLAPFLGVAVVSPDAPWPATGLAVVWWPVAGALGLTALVRGRRGRAVDRPQSDEVDELAVAAFRDRYGTPALAPVVVVIAAYNEVGGIRDVVAGLPAEVCGLPVDVIVVDDGSSDGTADAVASSDAYLCASPRNRGQGAALRLGYRLAREHGADYVVTTDADGQYDVADLPALVAPLVEGRADFVTGSRLLGHQETHDRVRRAGVHVFAWLVTLLTGRRVTDTSFGMRAMRAEVTEHVTLNQPQYQSSELLIGALSHGFRVLEVPATMHVRAAGSTKKGGNLVYGSRYARVVLGTWWREACPRPVDDTPVRALVTTRSRVDV